MVSTCAFAPVGVSSFRPTRGASHALRARAPVPWRAAPRPSRAARMVAEPITRPMTAPVMTPTRRGELCSLIIEGPIFLYTGMLVNAKREPERFEEWLYLGAFLEAELGDQATDVRVYQYYLPIFFWVERELNRHLTKVRARPGHSEDDVRPIIMGFSCPQGGGKTTMTTFIQKLLALKGSRTVIASLDDFYVPHAKQQAIAENNPGNPLMEHRGMPGTHDLPLLVDTLDQILEFCRDGLCRADVVTVPRFDKSLHGGRGDRAPRDQWYDINGTVDVMLLEGWCMGFEPVENVTSADMEAVNTELAKYSEVYDRLDSMLVIEIGDMEWVAGWRIEAERAMRAAGRNGLSDEQVLDFVGRFMPAYKHYSPGLYDRKKPICEDHELHIKIDHERKPVWRHLNEEVEV